MSFSGLTPSFTSATTTATMSAGTGLTAPTGNLTLSAGNLRLPTTTSALDAGCIQINNTTFFNNLGDNIIFGYTSGNASLTTATRNTCLGNNSLTAIDTSMDCIALGYGSLQFLVNGSHNIAMGYGSLNTLTNGAANVCLGYSTALLLDNGNFNVVLGFSSGSALSSAGESSNILISNAGVGSESNTIRIGTQGTSPGQQNACFIAGIAGVTVANSAAVLIDTSTGQLGTVASTIRLKENVKDMGSTQVMSLRPVTFNFKSDETKSNQYGLIAEEVAKVMPDIVIYDDNKQPLSVQYHLLPAILLNEIQKLSKRIEILEAKK